MTNVPGTESLNNTHGSELRSKTFIKRKSNGGQTAVKWLWNPPSSSSSLWRSSVYSQPKPNSGNAIRARFDSSDRVVRSASAAPLGGAA